MITLHYWTGCCTLGWLPRFHSISLTPLGPKSETQRKQIKQTGHPQPEPNEPDPLRLLLLGTLSGHRSTYSLYGWTCSFCVVEFSSGFSEERETDRNKSALGLSSMQSIFCIGLMSESHLKKLVLQCSKFTNLESNERKVLDLNLLAPFAGWSGAFLFSDFYYRSFALFWLSSSLLLPYR